VRSAQSVAIPRTRVILAGKTSSPIPKWVPSTTIYIYAPVGPLLTFYS